MSHLFLFTIGPVQSYIAAARRTQDLYVGSRLLSQIAGAGVATALKADAGMLFPYVIKGQMLPENIPHRFAFISPADPQHLAEVITAEMKAEWATCATKVKHWLLKHVPDNGWVSQFEEQTQNWLEVYWVAVPYDTRLEREEGYHARRYQVADRALAARKQVRHFPAVVEAGRKCSLTGTQAVVLLDWKKLKKELGDSRNILLRPNEQLGGVALVKRFYQRAMEGKMKRFPDVTTIAKGENIDLDSFIDADEPSDEPLFLAVLHMDGDRMGQALSHLASVEDHQEFSACHANFSQKAAGIVAEYNPGKLVYAGGDDVLALLPLKYAIPCARELQEAFQTVFRELRLRLEMTASAGISITPHQLPLGGALDEARLAEHHAKEAYGRNALVIREAHRSGQIREAGGKWDILATVEALQNYFADDTLSGKLGYDWLELAHDLDGEITPRRAILCEAIRLLKRRIKEDIGKDKKDAVVEDMKPLMLFAVRQGWEQVAHWAILTRLLAKGVSRA